MQRGHPQRAWRAWRDTIIAVVAVIVIGSLASANPSLRAPRGPHESILVVPTGATGTSGPAGLSAPTGTTTPEIEPGEEGEPSSDGADFTACEGLTGLDNAICRHEALLVVHPDNQGLQNSLTHLLERRAEHEEKDEGFHRVERSFGRFSRSLDLPRQIAADQVNAKLDRGVLEVRIPKPEERKPRRIEIKAAHANGNGKPATLEGSATETAG